MDEIWVSFKEISSGKKTIVIQSKLSQRILKTLRTHYGNIKVNVPEINVVTFVLTVISGLLQLIHL